MEAILIETDTSKKSKFEPIQAFATVTREQAPPLPPVATLTAEELQLQRLAGIIKKTTRDLGVAFDREKRHEEASEAISNMQTLITDVTDPQADTEKTIEKLLTLLAEKEQEILDLKDLQRQEKYRMSSKVNDTLDTFKNKISDHVMFPYTDYIAHEGNPQEKSDKELADIYKNQLERTFRYLRKCDIDVKAFESSYGMKRLASDNKITETPITGAVIKEPKAVKKEPKTLTQAEKSEIIARLKNFEVEKEAEDYINSFAFNLASLRQLAKYCVIPNHARLNKRALVSNLVSVTVGTKLRYRAL